MKRSTFLLITFLLFSCLHAQTLIIYGDNASVVEKNAINDLNTDIAKVCQNESVFICNESDFQKQTQYTKIILAGTKKSHSMLKALCDSSKLQLLMMNDNLPAETFLIEKVRLTAKPNIPVLAIIGADERGLFYGVYEFSKQVLNIDALEFWTGKTPQPQDTLHIPDIIVRVDAPVFPLRGYFDNDDDMLANWKGRKLVVEFDIWQEMINSLMRMRYNFIDIHDLLGRAEYYKRDYYINMVEYHTDLELVEQVIDYAHSKGMLVQVPMYLGWEFHHISDDHLCLSEHMDEWMKIYRYYLNKSPLGKADLFLQRPRHPYWDTAYKCPKEKQAGIETGPLMNKMFQGLYNIIIEHNPNAILFCDLWSEGRPMFNSGSFQPNRNIKMLWADHGFAEFGDWPEETPRRKYDFGIYIHAGVWKNHVLQDPYPGRIKEASLEAMQREMTSCYLVNGQDFKHFILNLEACALAAWDPVQFDPEQFYTDWTSRYFSHQASGCIIESLKLLHKAHQPVGGYRDITAMIETILKNLADKKLEKVSLPEIASATGLAELSLQTAENTLPAVPETCFLVYDDQIVFPARIYEMNLRLLEATALYNNFLVELQNHPNMPAKTELYEQYSYALRMALISIRNTLTEGSMWKKWEGWTKPEHFRLYNPMPKVEWVDEIINTWREEL